MKSYRITINSNKRAIVTSIVIFILIVICVTFAEALINFENIELPEFVVVILFLGLVVLFGYLIVNVSRGVVDITLSEDGFRMKWVERFIFSKESDLTLNWNEIYDYVYEEHQWLSSFRLKLSENLQFKIFRYDFFQSDDFELFIKEFPGYADRLNTQGHSIEEGRTGYQRKSFKWLLVVMTLVTIWLLVDKLIDSDAGITWPKLGALIFGVLYFWGRAMRRR